MKIAGYFCSCVGRVVDLDHYESLACKNPPAPIPWILAGLRKELNDPVHRDNQMSASRFTKCLRSTAIADNIPSVIDVRDLDAMTDGTARHKLMQENTPAGWESEIELKAAPLFVGTDCEIMVRGTADLFMPEVLTIQDYKITSEWSQKFRFERGADDEWSVQFSIYAILLERERGIKIKRGAVWSGAHVGKRSKAPAWFIVGLTKMSEAEILDFHPLGGEFSIREMIREYKLFTQRLAEGMPVVQAVALIPLMGEKTKKFKECDYCIVASKCRELAGEAEW